MRLFSVRTK